MHVQTKKDLMEVFKMKIIPLLKEYFYNDYGKIRLVLGEGFVEKRANILPKFAVSDHDEMNRELFVIKEMDDSFDIAEALKKTLG